MTIGKRSVRAVLAAAVGALLLSGCYTVVDGGHYYRPKPHYGYHQGYDHRPHHYRHDDRRRGDDRDHRHRRRY